MSAESATLFEFVGIVLPISFVGLRILLDEIDEIGGIPEEATANAYMNHVIGMIAFLVAAGWLAILDLLVSPAGVPLTELGYVSAAVGITVPVWLLATLRNEFDAADYGGDG